MDDELSDLSIYWWRYWAAAYGSPEFWRRLFCFFFVGTAVFVAGFVAGQSLVNWLGLKFSYFVYAYYFGGLIYLVFVALYLQAAVVAERERKIYYLVMFVSFSIAAFFLLFLPIIAGPDR